MQISNNPDYGNTHKQMNGKQKKNYKFYGSRLPENVIARIARAHKIAAQQSSTKLSKTTWFINFLMAHLPE